MLWEHCPSAGSHALTNTLIEKVEKLVGQYIRYYGEGDSFWNFDLTNLRRHLNNYVLCFQIQVKLRDVLRIAMLVSSERNWYLQVQLCFCYSLSLHSHHALSFPKSVNQMYWILCLSLVHESQFWKVYKEDKDSCDVIMRTAAGLVYLLACLLEPYVPSVSIEVIDLDLGWIETLLVNKPLVSYIYLCSTDSWTAQLGEWSSFVTFWCYS